MMDDNATNGLHVNFCSFLFHVLGGYSPVQLEWSMKLWWVHCEALVAGLMAFRATHSTKHWNMFTSVLDYTKSHVSYSQEQN